MEPRIWFQFLIGRLQTVQRMGWRLGLICFNSSQVGYKPSGGLESHPLSHVSIPHRQATNEVGKNCITWYFFSFNSSQVGYKLFNGSSIAGAGTGFNSSQVGYKRQYVSPPATNAKMFQFLIGRLQTPYLWASDLSFRGFNSSQVGYKHVELDRKGGLKKMFQFLIGRLQTIWVWTSCCRVSQFQFLIGRLQTKGAIHLGRLGDVFQFLIGRLQTMVKYPIWLICWSFNSSQVGYKLRAPLFLRDRQAGFQFLIGRLQTSVRYIQGLLEYRVSIPHRQATNISRIHIN